MFWGLLYFSSCREQQKCCTLIEQSIRVVNVSVRLRHEDISVLTICDCTKLRAVNNIDII